jgi:RNA polymerase sporulation-specific sigma factor
MIGYLENEAGLEIKNKMHENVIKFSNQFDNNRNSKKPKEKVKIKVVVEEPIIEEVKGVKVLKDENGKLLRGSEQRRKYYENNFFNTTADNFKCSELMSKELGFSEYDIGNALLSLKEPVSMYEPIYNDGADALFIVDQIGDEKNIDENWVENIAINESLKHLKDREKMIIKKRFFDGKTQMEVADEIGISQAQVSRLEKTALLHMKKSLR